MFINSMNLMYISEIFAFHKKNSEIIQFEFIVLL